MSTTKQDTYYDNADWHFESALNAYLETQTLPSDELTEEQVDKVMSRAAVHIGFFLAWVIKHHFEGSIHEDLQEDLQAVREERMTGVEFLLKNCDGKFWGKDVRDDIVDFVNYYYVDIYLKNYPHWVMDEIYDLPFEFSWSWDDYHLIEPIIDKAYQSFKGI